MSIRKLERKDWGPFLDYLSKLCEGRQAEIGAESLALGDQVEARWLPLIGITFDPKDDLIEFALEGLDHLIHWPREVYIDEGNESITSLEIIDADGVRQIAKFKEPLMLPPPR
jgi:hypothetical protein